MEYRRTFLLIIAYVVIQAAIAQSVTGILEDFSSYELQVRQKPHSEEVLAGLLSGIESRSDTLYAVIYYPNACRRCENLLTFFDRSIKRAAPNAETVLISVYPDAALADYYLRREGYHFDYYVYDTTDAYKRTLSFNLNSMNSTFVLKVLKSTGELLLGGDMGEVDDAHFAQLVGFGGKMEQHDYGTGSFACPEQLAPDCPVLDETQARDYYLGRSPHPASTVWGTPVFTGDRFFYNDLLDESIYVFQAYGDSLVFVSDVKVNDEEKDQFIEAQPEFVDYMRNSHSLYYMPLGPFMADDGKEFCVAYSLPNLYVETEVIDGDTLAENVYANKASIIRRDASTFQPLPMHPINIDLENMEFFYSHFTPSIIGNNIVMGCRKLTWPMDVPTEYYRNQQGLDPFLPSFYDNAPVFAVFNRSMGLIKAHYGALDKFSEKSRTGYVYNEPLFAVNSGQLAYCNKYAGNIIVVDTTDFSKPVEQYQIFELDTAAFTPDPSQFYTKDYRFHFDCLFRQTVVQLALTNTNIYCLLCYGNHASPDLQKDSYVFVEINRDTGKSRHWMIPPVKDALILSYGLRESHGNASPFVFYRKNEQNMVRVYKILKSK